MASCDDPEGFAVPSNEFNSRPAAQGVLQLGFDSPSDVASGSGENSTWFVACSPREGTAAGKDLGVVPHSFLAAMKRLLDPRQIRVDVDLRKAKD